MVRALDLRSAVVGSIPDRGIIEQVGQVVHTNVPLFTKQYNLVTCEGFHANASVMWQRHGVQ